MPGNGIERAMREIRHIAGQRCSRAGAIPDEYPILFLGFGGIVDTVHSEIRGGIEMPLWAITVSISCAWRLEAGGAVVCTCDEEDLAAVEVRRALAALEGQRVLAAELSGPAGDLTIEFEDGCTVRAFCCLGLRRECAIWDYYFVHDQKPPLRFSLGPRGKVNFEWPESALANQ